MRPSFVAAGLSRHVAVRDVRESGDVLLVFAVLAVTVPVQLMSASTPLRSLFGLPLLLFFPGYGLLLFLFPSRHRSGGRDDPGRRSLRSVERLALSFGISLTLAPLVALGYALVDIPLEPSSVTVGFSVLTAGFLAAGEVRRRHLPRSERFVVPFDRLSDLLRDGSDDRTGWDVALNVALLFAVVFALASLGYGLVVPNSGERYTNFYLVTQDGTGELVAADYPVNLTDGEAGELIVGVDNHEGRAVDYHLVVQLHRVGVDPGGGEVRVLEREDLERYTLSVPANGTGRATVTVPPVERLGLAADTPGTHLRLSYLLYVDEVPDEATIDTAYRSTYLWLDADGGGPGASVSTRPAAATPPPGGA